MKKSQRKKLLVDGYKEMTQETIKITNEFEEAAAEFKKLREN